MSGINGIVWVFSAVLAVVFLVTGVTKAYLYDVARRKFGWVQDLPQGLVQIIGMVEIVCALGLIVPVAFNVYPWLTSTAASLLIMLMVSSIIFHIRRKESDEVPLNVLLLILLLFVAYGRWGLLSLIL